MIIRSQNGMEIINFNNIEGIYCGSNSNNIFIGGYWEPIAEYNSKEDVIKVLDMIAMAYTMEEFTDERYNGQVEYPARVKNNTVFNMPKAEDVK